MESERGQATSSKSNLFAEKPSIASSSRSGWPKSLYLLYSHCPTSSMRNSLFKIDLPFPQNNPNSEELVAQFDVTPSLRPPKTPLSPMIEFPVENGEYHPDMKCIRLGSKLYFLGGQVWSDDVSDYDDVYRRDVYVLDLASGSTDQIEKLNAGLNSGKPNPCVFVADGKIYALGSGAMMTMSMLPEVDFISFMYFSFAMKGKFFERYDPSIGEWQVLEDPPLEDIYLTSWEGCSVFEDHGLVLFFGWQGDKRRNIRLLYDVRRNKWAPVNSMFSRRSRHFFTTACSHGHALYGINMLRSPIKLEFKLEEGDGDCPTQYHVAVRDVEEGDDSASVVEIINDELKIPLVFRSTYLESTTLLHSLGDGYFCYVISGFLPRPQSRYDWGFQYPDPSSVAVKIIIFKDIHGDGTGDDNYTSRKETSNRKSFEVNILYSREYVIRNPSYILNTLDSSLVVSHDLLKKMKKKIKREMKKQNKDFTDKGDEETE